jgi:hypothetical protein
MTTKKNEIVGKVGNVRYSVDKSVVNRLKEKSIDAILEIEEALKKVQKNENQSTKE